MSIIFSDGSNSVGIHFSHQCSWTNFRLSLNSLCHFLMLELLRHSFLKAFFSNAIVSLGVFSSWMKNLMQTYCLIFEFIFLQLKQHPFFAHFFFTCCKNHAIYCTMFVLVLNDAGNIPLSKNIVVLSVLFTHVPSLSSKDAVGWQGLATSILKICTVSLTLLNIEGLSHALSTHFEPFYTNM